MSNEYLTWFGYAASAIIALSMTMNSIVKFRWINLVGAISFATYGLLIHAIPVTFLNGFIALVDIYYLSKIYSKKEQFETLEVRADNKYLLKFLKFYNNESQKFFPGFEYKPEMNTISFFILRNMNVAGVFLAHHQDDETIRVGLDFVIPEYRDFKNGKYIFHRLRNEFVNQGVKKVVSPSYSKKHSKYLLKMGFRKTDENLFEKRF
jgi:N-acetylglutamate synthase-like GNAT family acetyltransferase